MNCEAVSDYFWSALCKDSWWYDSCVCRSLDFWDADTGTRRFSQSNRQSIAGRYMRKKIVPLLFLLIIGAESCATKELRVQEFRVAAGTPDPGKPPEEFYVIGAGDVLNINVWKEPSLSGTVKVRPDGFVTVPLVNEIQVVGMTTTQLRRLLETKYKEFTVDPFVTVRSRRLLRVRCFWLAR